MKFLAKLPPREIESADQVLEGVVAEVSSGNHCRFWPALTRDASSNGTRIAFFVEWRQPPTPEDRPPDWQPEFLDYLFLAYNTATAFSPTDALPVTRRAKALMLVESAISLLTMVIVVSRAVSALSS